MIEFLNLIGRMFESGFTWAAIVSALLALEKYYDKRQNKKLLYLIAKKVGVEWDTPQEELKKMVLLNYKRLSLLSHKEIIRRRMIMEKLKSRKFWLTILAALIPVLNTELGIDLNFESVVAIMTAIVAGIVALAHVDAKKILAGVLNRSATVTVSGSSNVAWQPMTFKDGRPLLVSVRNDINDLLTNATYPDKLQETLQTFTQVKAVIDSRKPAEPLPEVAERQETD